MKKMSYLLSLTTIIALGMGVFGCGDNTKEENITNLENIELEISEVMASNSHTIMDRDYYAFSDWIEIHNLGNKTVDIGGYQLSDKLDKPKWTIPNGTMIDANGYIIIWADEKDKKKNELHTNFKLKDKGEAVALFDKTGKVIDAFKFKEQIPDVSITTKDGKIVHMSPTPNKTNNDSFLIATLSQKTTFSLDEGSYSGVQTLTLSGDEIYYTTNGSIPTKKSRKYTTPISIDKTMAVRAINFEDGKLPSKVSTKSYLIDEKTTLPVFFISIDDKYLNDDNFGIYTVGKNGKTLPCGENNADIKANYFQKWERPAHMTFFEDNKSVQLSQDIGLKVSGSCSKIFPQKSFQLRAREKYGKKSMKYKMFADKDIEKFEKIKLRNSGQDTIKAHMRDALTHMIVKDGDMHLNYEAYRPCVVFLNGEYWGLYSIREKMGDGYIKNNYADVDSKKIDIIKDSYEADEGNTTAFNNLMYWTLTDEPFESEQKRYEAIASQVDIDNYIDYMITNIYIANSDWPATNTIQWKEQKKGSKWQWLLHDMDFGFALYEKTSDANYPALEKASTYIDGIEWPNSELSTRLFRKLLETPEFKAKFVNRFNNELNSTFESDKVIRIIDRISNKIDPEMEKQINRWDSYKVKNKQDWKNEVERLREFARQRTGIIQDRLKNF